MTSGGREGAQEFHWPVRIYYEDTDAAGIVYHANYLKFMERARTEWLREIGFEQNDLATRYGIVFVVRKITIDYLRPARFNNHLCVLSKIRKVGPASIFFEQNVLAADELITRGDAKIGCINIQSNRPVAMPEAVYAEVSIVAG